MKSLFNLDSPVMTILTEIADLIILNLIYLFFCMPIVTIGAATAALYRVMLNYEKGESVNPVRQFWKAFRENWKGATILFLIMLIPMACMLYYFLVIAASVYGGSKLTLVMSCIAALIIMMLWSFLWPMQAQFENKIGSTIKNSLILSIVHFPRAVLMSVINVLPLLLFLFSPELFLQFFIVWIMLGFALPAKINTKLILKVFRPFLEADTTSDASNRIKKRSRC